MNKSRTLAAALPFRAGRDARGVLVSALLATSVCGATAQAADGAAVEGEILVQLREGAQVAPLLVKHQLTLMARFGSRPIYRLRVIGSAKVKDKIEALKDEPEVRFAELNLRQEGPAPRKNVAWAIGDPQAAARQWGFDAVRLPEGHRLSRGAGVRVAVLDTGVDVRHPALAGRLLPGRDFVDGDSDPSEGGGPANRSFGHGTHVAGVVAMVAPAARIMPLRILDAQGSGNLWVLAEALLHAVDPDGNPGTNDGAHVINLSVGTLAKTKLFKTAIKLATCGKGGKADPGDAPDEDPAADGMLTLDDMARCKGFGGAVVVAAAGNSGDDKVREYPAGEKSPYLLSVAASNEAGELAAFSNYGWVKIAAPGEGVTSTVPGGGYATWGGTSMAAPFVSGAAALVRALDRRATADDVAKRLRESAQKLCGTSTRQLDIAAALGDEGPQIPRQCPEKR
jgi:subtilisin family serine protease